MFRSFFIYLSKAAWARKIVTGWSIAWRMASRFVAGENLDDAINAIRILNDKGINATLDHLGEHTTSAELANQATNDIILALDTIQKSSVRANVSVKLTQIGLGVSPDLCKENLEKVVAHAAKLNNFIRVDMEDSSTPSSSTRSPASPSRRPSSQPTSASCRASASCANRSPRARSARRPSPTRPTRCAASGWSHSPAG